MQNGNSHQPLNPPEKPSEANEDEMIGDVEVAAFNSLQSKLNGGYSPPFALHDNRKDGGITNTILVLSMKKKLERFQASRDNAVGRLNSLHQKFESTELQLYKMRDEVKKLNKAVSRRNRKIEGLKAKVASLTSDSDEGINNNYVSRSTTTTNNNRYNNSHDEMGEG